MSDREELARVIGTNVRGGSDFAKSIREAAADALWAAGWRKKPSVEELIDALSDDLNWNQGQEHPHLLMVNMAESVLALLDGPTENGES